MLAMFMWWQELDCEFNLAGALPRKGVALYWRNKIVQMPGYTTEGLPLNIIQSSYFVIVRAKVSVYYDRGEYNCHRLVN